MTANTIRALKSQARRKKLGLCVTCGKPAVNACYCKHCRNTQRVLHRNRYRLAHGIPLDAPLWGKVKL